MPIFEIENQKDNFYVYPETYALILIFKDLGEKGKEITCGIYKTGLFFPCLLRHTAIPVSLTIPQ